MKWLETHKLLAGILIVAIAVLLIVHKVVASQEQQAHDKVVLAQEQLREDLDKAKVQASATASDKQALQGQLNALTASNDALRRDLASLRLQLANQRQVNDAMAPDALSARWSMLIGFPGEIQPSAGGVTASLPAAHATVNQLEEIPVLKAEKAKIEGNSITKDTALAQALKTLGSTSAELDTCKNHTVPDAKNACKLEKDELKAKARKRNVVVAVLAAIGGFLIRSKI